MKSRVLFLFACLSPAFTILPARAELPRAPFSGVYGATSGAGALTAWDRLGGDNPAALGPPGWSASLAGYAPFGLEDLSVLEF